MTTTIRLPDTLKLRIAEAAKQAGKTPHAFIVEAIVEKAESAEQRTDFDAAAEQRYARLAESGQTIPWHEMRTYLKARISGETPERPAPRRLATRE